MWRVGHSSIPEGLYETLDAGDRCFQLVRHICHEVTPNVFEPAQLRDVIQHHQYAEVSSRSVTQGGRGDLYKAFLIATQDNFSSRRPGIRHGFGEQPLEANISDHLLYGSSTSAWRRH